MKYSLLILYLLVLEINVQSQQYEFNHITTDDGLSDNTVFKIISDKTGYIWFATQDGITRFDGRNYRIFENIDEDPNSLYGEVIMDISEDSSGNLWIASNGGGLNKFDPFTEEFEHFELDTTKNFYSATCLLHDRDQTLWVGGYSIGLNLFNKETQLFTTFPLQNNAKTESELFAKNSVLQIIEDIDDHNILWLATNDGLFKFNKSTYSVKRYSLNNWIQGVSCQSIYMNDSSTIWVGTWGSGLIKFNTKNQTYKSFYPNKHAFEVEKDFMQNVIFDIDSLNLDELWLSTRTMGVSIFNMKEHKFRFINSDPSNATSLLSNEVTNSFISDDKNIWVSNFAKGMNYFYNKENKIDYYPIIYENCNSNDYNLITDFVLDQDNSLLYTASMDCKTLSIFDTRNGFEQIKNIPLLRNSEGIKKIFLRSDGELIIVHTFRSITAKESSLLMYDKNKEALIYFSHPFVDEIVNRDGYFNVTDIIEDNNNNLWIGTEFQGLIKWNYKDDLFTKYLETSDHTNWLDSTIRISNLISASDGNIWMSTLDNAVYEFDVASETFRNFQFTLKRNHSAKLLRTTSIAEDRDGNIWVGTSADGIRIIDPKKDTKQNVLTYGRKEGITEEKIGQIITDRDKNIWISSTNGLFNFKHESESFHHYDKNIGISDSYLLNKGILASENGDIFIGQNHGFYHVNIDQLKPKKSEPSIILNSFKIFEEEKQLKKKINYLDKINLRYKENFFTIGFTNINFDPTNETFFRYQLKGVDPSWIYPSDKRQSANYTDIWEGNYEFLVSAKTSNTEWSTEPKTIKIKIEAPWYRTWWFYIISFSTIGIITNILFRYQLEQRLRVEKIRLKLSSDLHDELSGLLASIAMEAELLKLSTIQEENKNKLSKIGTSSRSAMKRMSDVIWAIDSRNDKMIHLIHRMMEHNQDMLTPLNIKYEFKTAELDENLNLSVNLRENLYYIYKEIINNIVKHAKANKVEIFVGHKNNYFVLMIKDNGVGLSKTNGRKGQGLSNIAMRAERIQAKLDVISKNGCTIVLRMTALS